MTSPGLDSSFVTNLFIHSTGKTREQSLAAARDEESIKEIAANWVPLVPFADTRFGTRLANRPSWDV